MTRLGVVFPQTEIGTDPGAIRALAQAAEALGYDHLLAYDHVLGVDATGREGWTGYEIGHPFHEPLVLYGYLAGVTGRIELATGIIILAQRQAVLVAKQAAEVEVLSRGRLRLGVGVGWNSVEQEAMGMEFRTRGRRIEEQVEVLRLLWTQEVVSFHGRWHHLDRVGIRPLPQPGGTYLGGSPIPIWMGGQAEAAMRRMARLADGWIAGAGLRTPTERHERVETRDLVARMKDLLRDAGRDPATFGIEGRVNAARGGPEDWAAAAHRWVEMGATHVSLNTMGMQQAEREAVGPRPTARLDTYPPRSSAADAHVDAMRRFMDATAGLHGR